MFISKEKLEELIDKRISEYRVHSCPEQMSDIETISYLLNFNNGKPSKPRSISEIPSILEEDYNTKIDAIRSSLKLLEDYLGIHYEENTTKGYVKNKKK